MLTDHPENTIALKTLLEFTGDIDAPDLSEGDMIRRIAYHIASSFGLDFDEILSSIHVYYHNETTGQMGYCLQHGDFRSDEFMEVFFEAMVYKGGGVHIPLWRIRTGVDYVSKSYPFRYLAMALKHSM